ncbi:peptide ABC transporter permease [Sulfurisphaera javensis]
MIRLYIILSLFFFLIFTSIFLEFYQLPKGKPLTPPNLAYPLGTYIDGRNMINVNAVAIINTLLFGSIVGLIETLISVTYGITAGILGGKIRTLMVRISDSINSIPRLPFLLSIALFYGIPTGVSLKANFFITAIIVALTGWPLYARQIAETIYTRSIGSSLRVMIRKVPLKLGFIVLGKKQVFQLVIPSAIDGISTYTAMGVIGGVGDPNYPTLTTLLNTASHLIPDWWLFLIPAIFRGILLILLQLLADEMRRI